MEFIRLLDDQDNLEVRTFSDELITISELSPLGPKRTDLLNRVSGITEFGGTSLYDATLAAYQSLDEKGNPKHIRAVVVLTDGMDTDSIYSIGSLLGEIVASSEGGNAIKIFTIAFGADADVNILNQISDVTGGKQYQGDIKNIIEIYSDIATFF
jgi:Ca-activated chloride channel family protein